MTTLMTPTLSPASVAMVSGWEKTYTPVLLKVGGWMDGWMDGWMSG